MQNEQVVPFLSKYGLFNGENSADVQAVSEFLPTLLRDQLLNDYDSNSILIEDLEALVSNCIVEPLAAITDETAHIEQECVKTEQQILKAKQQEEQLSDEMQKVNQKGQSKVLQDQIQTILQANELAINENNFALKQQIQNEEEQETVNERLDELLELKKNVINISNVLQSDYNKNNSVIENCTQTFENTLEKQEYEILRLDLLMKHMLYSDVWILVITIVITIFSVLLIW